VGSGSGPKTQLIQNAGWHASQTGFATEMASINERIDDLSASGLVFTNGFVAFRWVLDFEFGRSSAWTSFVMTGHRFESCLRHQKIQQFHMLEVVVAGGFVAAEAMSAACQ
jgi:hypothetical protein